MWIVPGILIIQDKNFKNNTERKKETDTISYLHNEKETPEEETETENNKKKEKGNIMTSASNA